MGDRLEMLLLFINRFLRFGERVGRDSSRLLDAIRVVKLGRLLGMNVRLLSETSRYSRDERSQISDGRLLIFEPLISI
jgi:hypothetical protein